MFESSGVKEHYRKELSTQNMHNVATTFKENKIQKRQSRASKICVRIPTKTLSLPDPVKNRKKKSFALSMNMKHN